LGHLVLFGAMSDDFLKMSSFRPTTPHCFTHETQCWPCCLLRLAFWAQDLRFRKKIIFHFQFLFMSLAVSILD